LKLNTFVFAGSQLEITSYNDESNTAAAEPSAEAQDLMAKFKSVLFVRYNEGAKLLSLNSLAQDPILVEMGSFQNVERAEKTFRALMKVCDDIFKTAKAKQDAIQSISLADNNIDNVVQVDSVAETFPDLKNLDLSGNSLVSLASLSKWKGRFRHLENLQMVRNPIVVEPNYNAALLDMFPRLQFLNGDQVRTPEQIAQVAAARIPKPLPQHGPDFRDTNGIGEAFLLEFFVAFDTDRRALLTKYYDDNSMFSLSVDTNSVRDANAPPPMPWAAYLKFSRNLKKITHDNARIQRLLRGGHVIYELWKDLPSTKHPDIKSETSKYVMDCHPIPGLSDPVSQAQRGVDGMVISVHGEFDEMTKDGKTGKRSFSRSFVLGPGQSGGIRVVSDMLCLRANNPLPNIFEQAPQPAPGQEQSQEAHQQAMTAELSKQTGMTAEYSRLCLEQSGWDFNYALALYNEKKVRISRANNYHQC
jgi:nuclear RNA export factor